MHSYLIQITKERLSKRDYMTYEEVSGQDELSIFADYATEVDDVERVITEVIPSIFEGIFDCNGRELTFISAEEYIKEWEDKVVEDAVKLVKDRNENLYLFQNLVHNGHKHDDIRICDAIGGCGYTFLCFMLDLHRYAKKGDKFYVCGIVDYHF